mmetsp:Transcript_35303/g.76632  ORF Transcript_35303/g.76632 Transcript_35303/m.76632 type:complete len:781 (-) Transcript_35303:813-3155(-)
MASQHQRLPSVNHPPGPKSPSRVLLLHLVHIWHVLKGLWWRGLRVVLRQRRVDGGGDGHDVHVLPRLRVPEHDDPGRGVAADGHKAALAVKVDELLLRGDHSRGVLLDLLARLRLGLRLVLSAARSLAPLLSVFPAVVLLLVTTSSVLLLLPAGRLLHLHALGLVLLRLLLRCPGLGLGRRRQHRRGRLAHDHVVGVRHRLRVGKDAGLALGVHAELGHVEVLVQADEGGGRQGQAHEVGERVPVPVLGEYRHAHDRQQPREPVPAPQADVHVPPARIDEAHRDDGAHLAHDVLVLVADDLVEVLPESRDPRLRLLQQDHRGRYQRPLPHKVDGVLAEGRQDGHGLLHASAGARNAQGHGHPVPHVRVEALREQRHRVGALLRLRVHHKAQAHHRRAPDVVADVAHRKVEELLDGKVAHGAAVGQADGKHAAVPQDGVLVLAQLQDERVGALLPAVDHQGAAQGEAPRDLLVLRVVGVREHLLCLVAARPDRQQPDRDARRLARHRRIRVQHVLQVLEHFLVVRAQGGQPNAQAGPVLHDLARRVPQRLEQEVADHLALVAVHQPQRVQRAALRERGPARALHRQVRGHEVLALRQLAPVNHSQAGRGTELGPVGRPGEPVQVLPQESVHGRAHVHQRIRQDDGAVADAVPRLHAGLEVLQDGRVRAVVTVQELKVQLDGGVPFEDRQELLRLRLPLGLLGRLARRRAGPRRRRVRLHGLRTRVPTSRGLILRGGGRGGSLRLGLLARGLVNVLGDLGQELGLLVLVEVEGDLVRQQDAV